MYKHTGKKLNSCEICASTDLQNFSTEEKKSKNKVRNLTILFQNIHFYCSKISFNVYIIKTFYGDLFMYLFFMPPLVSSLFTIFSQ